MDLKKLIRNISDVPVTSLFTTSTALTEAAHMMFELSGNAAFVTDTDGTVVYINQVAERFTGLSSHDARGQLLSHIVHLSNPKTGEAMDIPLLKVLVEARAMFLPDYTTLTPEGGQKLPVDGSLGPIFAKDGRVLGTILLLHDVSRYRLLTDALSLQANQDPLTGLVNRREFETRVSRALRNARMHKASHVLAYMDLDQFKIVNDVCGHGAGDELLRRIAAAMRSKVRERDTLARLGGDEFGLLLENCTIDAARQVCNNLLDAVKEISFTWQDRTFTVGVSIGLSVLDDDTEDIGTALASTDAACYRAKENGRGRIEVHNANLKEFPPASEASGIARIVSALDENRFSLFAQPIVTLDSVSGSTDFFEIHARLSRDNGGYIESADFLPAVERYQLMPTLDRWVIRHGFNACRKIYHGKNARKPTWSLTVSAASLGSEGFAAFVSEEAKRCKLPPEFICFQINGDAAAAKNSRAADFIWALKVAGFRFCITDFGKNIRALTSLKNLPVDFLKIDASFIKEILIDDTGMEAVKAIHSIGRIMGVKTIAESVDSQGTLKRLQTIGIDFAQGDACGTMTSIDDLGMHPVPQLPDFTAFARSSRSISTSILRQPKNKSL